MSRNNNFFRVNNKNQATQNDDQNQPNNVEKDNKTKRQFEVKPMKSLRPTQKPVTNQADTYRLNLVVQHKGDQKWQLLVNFNKLASKAQYLHNLKFQTLFLAYSLAQKTVPLVLNEYLTYEYWVVCCLFMSMKYEEIYPPRLKDLSMLIKQVIKSEDYNKSELLILEFIGLNLNFVSLNTYLSEYLHASTQQQRYFIFYLLQVSLSLRLHLKKFQLKELVLSVIYILSSHRLHFYLKDVIDGVLFSRIEECSKIILVSLTSGAERSTFLFKKYRSQRMKHVALNSIPCVENLTALLLKKKNKQESTPKIVGFCEGSTDDNMDQQVDDDNDQLIKILIEREKSRMSE